MELRLDDEGTQALFGTRDENLRMLEDEFGVKISSRGNEIFVQGKDEGGQGSQGAPEGLPKVRIGDTTFGFIRKGLYRTIE